MPCPSSDVHVRTSIRRLEPDYSHYPGPTILIPESLSRCLILHLVFSLGLTTLAVEKAGRHSSKGHCYAVPDRVIMLVLATTNDITYRLTA